jgi:hypothetical protein
MVTLARICSTICSLGFAPEPPENTGRQTTLMSMIANLETGIVNKFQIVPALAAPWDDMFKEEGSKFKLQFRSRATVRNKTTDNESEPRSLEVFSITSCKFQQKTCVIVFSM